GDQGAQNHAPQGEFFKRSVRVGHGVGRSYEAWMMQCAHCEACGGIRHGPCWYSRSGFGTRAINTHPCYFVIRVPIPNTGKRYKIRIGKDAAASESTHNGVFTFSGLIKAEKRSELWAATEKNFASKNTSTEGFSHDQKWHAPHTPRTDPA